MIIQRNFTSSLFRQCAQHNSNNHSPVVDTPKRLYKFLMRRFQNLPDPEMVKFYKHSVRQGFIQHSDEIDPERVQQMISQAVKDSAWVLKKYNVNEERPFVKHLH